MDEWIVGGTWFLSLFASMFIFRFHFFGHFFSVRSFGVLYFLRPNTAGKGVSIQTKWKNFFVFTYKSMPMQWHTLNEKSNSWTHLRWKMTWILKCMHDQLIHTYVLFAWLYIQTSQIRKAIYYGDCFFFFFSTLQFRCVSYFML